MKKDILLLEPNYKNKYPPIGLMKIATYHRMLGDNVTFFKGKLEDLIVDNIYIDCIRKFKELDDSIFWEKRAKSLKEFIKTKRKDLVSEILAGSNGYEPLLNIWLDHFSDIYKNKKYIEAPKYDRVYVTTLFTFYWKITTKTINFAKLLVKSLNELKVGGVMASLLPVEIERETGIIPYQGLLDKPGIFDDNDYIIDELPLDYSILDEIDYEYPTKSAYFTFMTKGCTRKCAFCSVPKLEPTYKEKIPTKDKFLNVKEIYGEQQNLLLMDNNVLASPKFKDIVEEIKDMGFYKGASFIEPNQFDIAVKNLRDGVNDKAYIKRTFQLLHKLLDTRLQGKVAQRFYDELDKNGLLTIETTKKENILSAYDELSKIYDKYRDKSQKLRYVDFNQGTDARYVTDEIMKLMSEIPIRPLRIAFDYIAMKDKYINAVELASKHGLTELSNYILYNFNDKPEDLYERLRVNIDLNKRLGTKIFSFPMKYIPLYGEDAKDRNYVGKYWNRKFIRSIQAILNVTKGIVAPGEEFFYKAFGKNIEEYYEILYMPEEYIIYRKYFEDNGCKAKWKNDLCNLSEEELNVARDIIHGNDFYEIERKTNNKRLLELLGHYTINYEQAQKVDHETNKVKSTFQKLIREDMFVDLTLTYDFE